MSTPCLNIAHRGARSLAPENTLVAAQKALEIGADGWELDVAMTADQEMVILHDHTLARTTNASSVFPDRNPWEVERFSLDELRRLDFGSWYNQFDPFGQIATGKVSENEQRAFEHISVLTLREALEFTQRHHWWVDVELKDLTGTPGDVIIVEKAVALISELALEDRVLISSFHHQYLVQVKKANPRIATAALVGRPHPDPVALLTDLGARAINPAINLADAAQFQALRAAGFDILVWTVNDPVDMRNLITMGATGLITDFPQTLKAVLMDET